MLFTRSWPITGACWWWSISPSPPGALAVAVAQDMGITVDYLPGLSMRRIADLAGLLGVFRTVLVCVSGCLLQVQEIAFDLVRGAIP